MYELTKLCSKQTMNGICSLVFCLITLCRQNYSDNQLIMIKCAFFYSLQIHRKQNKHKSKGKVPEGLYYTFNVNFVLHKNAVQCDW